MLARRERGSKSKRFHERVRGAREQAACVLDRLCRFQLLQFFSREPPALLAFKHVNVARAARSVGNLSGMEFERHAALTARYRGMERSHAFLP